MANNRIIYYSVASLIIFLFIFIFFMLSYDSLMNKKKPSDHEKRPEVVEIYKDQSGKPKYAEGNCLRSENCIPAGCSQQVCSDDPDLVTTCELREDFPYAQEYNCGCIEQKCVWFK